GRWGRGRSATSITCTPTSRSTPGASAPDPEPDRRTYAEGLGAFLWCRQGAPGGGCGGIGVVAERPRAARRPGPRGRSPAAHSLGRVRLRRDGAGRGRAGGSASGLPGQRGGAWPAVSRDTAAPPGHRAAREVLARRIPAPARPRRCRAAPPPSTLGGPGGRRFLTTGRTGLLARLHPD